MQIEDFVKSYQAKSAEELIRLAVAPEQLTSEARLALQGELSRRAISIADTSEGAEEDGTGSDARRSTNIDPLQKGDQQHERAGDFVVEVLRTYQGHFWLYFRITAPAVIISTIAIMTARNEVRNISRHLPRGVELLAHRADIWEIGLIHYSAWFVSWLATSCMFAAICIAVEESAAGFTPSASHSFLGIRERLGPFLRLSLVLFVLVLVAGVGAMLLERGVFWTFDQWQVRFTGFLIMAVSYVSLGLAVLVVSRFFLSVPAVILDDYSVRQALFRSDKLTQGKWLTLAALLAKSLIGGYVAAMGPFWLVSLVPVAVPLPSWFQWVLTVASIICITVVEPTMFVGFALLYLKMSALDSAPSKVLASQLA